MKKCGVCTENPSKYCCPGCELRTCCLTCVQKHKTDSGCTGQRDKTAYVAMKSFTDINLLSDYRFLEDAGRKNNNASRDYLKRKHFKPNFLKELEKQAGVRKIELRTMPYPMSRRKNNFTTYHYKTKEILWQIEWLFPTVNLTLTDKRVPDSSSLESVLDCHINDDADPMIKHKLRPYVTAGKHRWGLFMKQENNAQSRYHRLDMALSVVENLKNKCVIEYPTILVVLEQDWPQYQTDACCDSKQDTGIVEAVEASTAEPLCSTSYVDSRVADEVHNTDPGQHEVPSSGPSQTSKAPLSETDSVSTDTASQLQARTDLSESSLNTI